MTFVISYHRMQSETAVSCFFLLQCSNQKFQLINFIVGTFEQKTSTDDYINDNILDKNPLHFYEDSPCELKPNSTHLPNKKMF